MSDREVLRIVIVLRTVDQNPYLKVLKPDAEVKGGDKSDGRANGKNKTRCSSKMEVKKDVLPRTSR